MEKTLKERLNGIINTEKFKNAALVTLAAANIALYAYADSLKPQENVFRSGDYSAAVKIDKAHKYNPNPSVFPRD